ncbi:JAB domain-containing protein [Stenotrophomonas maltophilia]|uniref:JAB domain-containing protein n=1 Tax=Stenotrophomonas maltophilia TaxID=40324 RepID=UPI0015F1FB94|nr:JAB domain-containing protein [Stenotrophomonas maltophilia]QDY50898.1 hypothetical protein DUW70_21400 [Stenotrophomonas maltophilia]
MEALAYNMSALGGGSCEEENRIRIREDRAIARALKILERRAGGPKDVLGGVTESALFFQLRLAGEQREHFEVAFLNTQFQLIAVEAARQGFANGAFEDLDEDVPAVVEEFYPTGHGEVAQAPANGSLKDRLEAQASRLAS